ncbi:hypothetical protein O1611_g2301 [Lasiodiplodia mahajangana]|uniref:Uncharacterized protein n=1 Tax=Lasiodiplodia mahajangana TaxID=1108764 RepID=A0ACC2JVN4_9PEZI|nr:hypothetical protein O1611_g2301 [Lasiodiplodia mahajangana]
MTFDPFSAASKTEAVLPPNSLHRLPLILSTPQDDDDLRRQIQQIDGDNVRRVAILSFRSLQLHRIAKLQAELVKRQNVLMNPTLPEPPLRGTDEPKIKMEREKTDREVDDLLQRYADAVRNYETLSQNVEFHKDTPYEFLGGKGVFKVIGRTNTTLWDVPKWLLGNNRQMSTLPSYLIGSIGFRELDKGRLLERGVLQRIRSRFHMALFGGVALIAPVILMTLKPTLVVDLATVSVATALFALTMVIFATDASGKDVLTSTAGYAAVMMPILAKVINDSIVEELFVPIGRLREIWNEDELREFVMPVNLTDQQIQFAQKNLLRTLSLLAYIGRRDLGQVILQWIQDEKNFDEILHGLEYETLFPNRPPSKGPASESPAAREYFLQEVHFQGFRKYFTAVVLTEGKDTTLQHGQVMPLVSQIIVGSGMGGDIMGHEIPWGHLVRGNTSNSTKVLVAKKTFPDANSKEIPILADLRRLLLNTNIPICTCISLIKDEGLRVHSLSYRSDSDLGSLIDRLNGDGEINEQHLSDSIRQIRGIAEALNFLHTNSPSGSDEAENTVFCHMDIKPQNILVFNSSTSTSTVGDWKVIDFGISTMSKMKGRRTGGGPREEGRRHITVTVGTQSRHVWGYYQSPEVNDHASEGTQGRVGRGSDVWSLGCVFAEVLAANKGGLLKLQQEILSYSDLFYEESKAHSCSCDNISCPLLSLPCPRHKRNQGFENWLERELSQRADLNVCKDLILDMTKIRRIQRLKAMQIVRRIDAGGLLNVSS